MMMIDYIEEQAQYMMNNFPSKTGIYVTISAGNIIRGRTNLDYNTMSLNLVAYIQLFEGTENTQQIRSVGAVALNTPNEKVGYYFMFIRTGRKIHGLIWMELPIKEEVITRDEDIGKKGKHLLMKNGPIFE